MASDTKYKSCDEWLQFLESNQDRDGLRAFMAFTFEVGASGDVTMLDAILSNARPEQLGILLSTGMLRSTWRLSNHLPGWIPFRDRTKEWLVSGGEDWKRIMVGMFRDKPYEDTFGLDHLLHTHPSLK